MKDGNLNDNEDWAIRESALIGSSIPDISIRILPPPNDAIDRKKILKAEDWIFPC